MAGIMSIDPLDIKHVNEVRNSADLIHDQGAVEGAYDTMAAAIRKELAGRCPVIVCVLIGGIVPTGNILGRLNMECELSYVHATRYRKTTKGSDLSWVAPVYGSIKDRDVLIIDDILDEGLTLAALESNLLAGGARTVLKAVLTRKKRPEPSATHADFIGLEVPNRYVFGSGMDYKGYLRDMQGIWALPA